MPGTITAFLEDMLPEWCALEFFHNHVRIDQLQFGSMSKRHAGTLIWPSWPGLRLELHETDAAHYWVL